MDPVNYYVTTLSNAFSKLLPYFIFLVGGYFIFIRLPFLFFRKSMDSQKKKLQEEEKAVLPEKKYGLEDYQEFQRKLKLLNGGAPREEQNKKEEKKNEQKKSEEKPKRPTPVHTQGTSAEEVFGFKKGESISKSELKKRYFELLKQNHPDRVASLGQDFKKLAEKNTKDINLAYEKLKGKAS